MIKNNIRKRIAYAYLITLIVPIQTIYSAPTYGTPDPTYGTPTGTQTPTYGTPVTNSYPTPAPTNNGESTVVYIHQTVRTLNNDADCSPTQWDTPEDACSCCLMRNKGKRGNKKSADAIIEQCTKTNKQCTPQAITNIKKQYNLPATASSQDFFNRLEDNIVIKNMDIDKSLLGANGAFTETSLPKFLAQAYSEKKLKNADFSKEACLKAKNLGTQGGYNTLQLFLITSTCHAGAASMYIIKEARNGIDEASKLKRIAEYPKMKELIAPNIVPGLPSIALPLAYFSYPDTKAVHYLAAMPAAKGKDLSAYIIQFRDNQSAQNKELLSRAFTILGRETANFHKRFDNKVAHGDFHTFNIFFDPISGHSTWIDAETMANSFDKPTGPAKDIVKLFYMPFCINSTFQQFRDLIKGIDLKTWCDIAVNDFVIGYKDTFKPQEQKQAIQELRKMFLDPFTITWVDFDQQKLSDIQKNYISPIFDELLKK